MPAKPRARRKARVVQQTQRAVIQTGQLAAATATVTTSPTFKTVIVRTERCFDVVGDPDMKEPNDHYINPSNGSLFPWLSKIAPYFDSYRFQALKFRYVPSCGTTTVGQFGFAIDYDPCDTNGTLELSTLQAMGGAVTGQLYASMSLFYAPVNGPVGNHKFFTSSTDTTEVGARFDHVGRLLAVHSATPTTKTVYGAVFADYMVELSNPQDVGPGYSDAGKAQTTVAGATAVDPVGTVTTSVVATTRADQAGSPNKTKKIVRIIDGVITAIGQIAPFIGMVAKLFLSEYMPLLPGVAYLQTGSIPVAYADLPGDSVMTCRSVQCRQITVVARLAGRFVPVPPGTYPLVSLVCSTNVTARIIFGSPNSTDAAKFATTCDPCYTDAMWEIDFTDKTTETFWFKVLVLDSSTNAPSAGWTGISHPTSNFVNAFVKTDCVV